MLHWRHARRGMHVVCLPYAQFARRGAPAERLISGRHQQVQAEEDHDTYAKA